MKQYIGISRDHSGSMSGVAASARKDYNELVAQMKLNAIKYGVDTVLSVVECGIKDTSVIPNSNDWYRNTARGETVNRFAVTNSSIAAVSPIASYPTTGGSTPLFDSVKMLVDQMKSVPDYSNPDVSFLVLVVTDGESNRGMSGYEAASFVKELEKTDKWTFVFRVPNGYKNKLKQFGFNEGNVLEFDAGSVQEFEKSTAVTASAVNNFYEGRTHGVMASRGFYASTENLTPTIVKQELTNISKKVKVIPIAQEWDKKWIKDFVEAKTGNYVLGTVHYQLTKKETVQDSKRLIVWDKLSGNYYTGYEARSLLGFPANGDVRVTPGNFPQYELFIQSNSVNRHLVAGTKVVIYHA